MASNQQDRQAATAALNSDADVIASLKNDFRVFAQQAEATLTFVRAEAKAAAAVSAQAAAATQQQQSSELCDAMLQD